MIQIFKQLHVTTIIIRVLSRPIAPIGNETNRLLETNYWRQNHADFLSTKNDPQKIAQYIVQPRERTAANTTLRKVCVSGRTSADKFNGNTVIDIIMHLNLRVDNGCVELLPKS
jgi:hypothetical protein